MLREEGRLEELADTGARIQMNYSSIDGGWNNNTAQWCKRQLKDGLVHYLGTDMHNSGERSPQTEHVEKWLNKNLSEDYVWALIQGNARRILDDRGSHKPKHKLFQNFLQFKKGQVRNKRNPRKWEGKNTHNSKRDR